MGCLIGLDVDPDALQIAGARLRPLADTRQPAPELHLLQRNFGDIGEVAAQLAAPPGGLSGILLDLGMSSMQVGLAPSP